jgi:hypothetical protein
MRFSGFSSASRKDTVSDWSSTMKDGRVVMCVLGVSL